MICSARPRGSPVRGELGVVGPAPLLEQFRYPSRPDDAGVEGLNDEVVRLAVADLGPLVGGEAVLLALPQTAQQADGAADDLRQVALDVGGVLAGQLDLARETQVV